MMIQRSILGVSSSTLLMTVKYFIFISLTKQYYPDLFPHFQ